MRKRILPTILLITILVMCLTGCANRLYSSIPDENLTEVTEDNFTILAMPTSSRSVSKTHYKYSLWHGDMIPVSTEKTVTDYYVVAKHRSGYCCRFQLDELDWRAYQVGNQIPLQIVQKYDVVGEIPHNPYVAYNGKKLVAFKKLSEKESRIYEENYAEILAEEDE